MWSLERTEAWQRALVVALPALVTLPRFRNGFVFDDVFVIERSDFIHSLGNLPRVFSAHAMIASSLDAAIGQPALDTYRPISIGSFFWDAALSGRAPWSYHLTNLLLHASVCGLLFTFLRRLLGTSSPVPWLTALCFGLSPWLAEGHVWINGRSDPLVALFVLSALLVQRRALDEGRLVLTLGSGALALAALLCKETAVCTLAFIAAVPTQQPVPWSRRARAGVPLVVAFLLYVVLRAHALHGLHTHENAGQLWAALCNLPVLLVDGVYHTLVPSLFALRNLRDDYAAGGPPLMIVCTLVCVALGATLVRLRRRAPIFVWSVCFGAATLAPAMMITTSLWPGFGRYLYVPALGFQTALATAVIALQNSYPAAARGLQLALAATAVAAAVGLFDATQTLRDEPSTYLAAMARAPAQAWPIGFLGLSKKRAGRCDEAIPLLAVAARRDESEPRYAVHLAYCLVELGELDRARAVAQQGQQRFRGTRAEPGFLLAQALTLPADHTDQVRALLDRCLAVDPGRTDCAEQLATLPAR